MLHAFELHAIVAEHGRQIAALRAELRQLQGGRRAGDAEAELVKSAFEAMGGRAFCSAELLARALRTDGPGLRLAALLAGRSVRSVGRLLAAAAGKMTPEGLILRSAGTSRAGVVWRIAHV